MVFSSHTCIVLMFSHLVMLLFRVKVDTSPHCVSHWRDIVWLRWVQWGCAYGEALLPYCNGKGEEQSLTPNPARRHAWPSKSQQENQLDQSSIKS